MYFQLLELQEAISLMMRLKDDVTLWPQQAWQLLSIHQVQQDVLREFNSPTQTSYLNVETLLKALAISS